MTRGVTAAITIFAYPAKGLRHGEENDKLTQISVRTSDVPNFAAAMH